MNTSDFLKSNVRLFKDFSDDRLNQLLNGSRVGSFEAHEAVARYGEKAAHLNVVLSGGVSASVVGDGGARRVLGSIKAGGTFGELALMTGDALLADFIAEEPSQVLQIPVLLFQSVIMGEPAAVQQVSRTVMERFKEVAIDPSKAAAALRQSKDPYGLQLKGERPEKILVINCGSSSVKYQFYDTAKESRQARGLVERIGIHGTRLVHHGPGGEVKRELPSGGVAEAFAAMVSALSGASLTPNRWAPVFADLGVQDRGVAMRVAPVFATSPEEPARQLNVEFRVADGSNCPYLALGAIVWAGVDGLVRNLALRAPGAESPLLPRSLESALAALETDPVAASRWSNQAMSAYLAFKRAEIKALEGISSAQICERYAAVY